MNTHPHHHGSNQNPATDAALQQANSISKKQMCNGNVGGLYPNNGPIAAPSCFMNFPNHPFPLQNTTGQYPNGIGGFNPQQNFNSFPVNQFYPSQQQQAQFFANNMIPTVYNQNVGLPNEQVLLQNTIQNIQQLLQLQNPNQAQFPPGNPPMFQNQLASVTGHQNSGFPVNQQFGMSNPMQHANQGQQRLVSPMMDANASKQLPNMGQQLPGNTFLPHTTSGPVQTQQSQNLLATLTNFQNQIAQGVGPQNHIFLANQLFAMSNMNGPMQHVNQGQHRFISPMMDVNASRPIANTGDQGSSIIPLASASVQTQNPCSTLTTSEDNHGNMAANVNGGWAESQRKNFTGHKRSDASHPGFKSPLHHSKHVKQKLGVCNRSMNKECKSNVAVNSGSQNFTKFEKKVRSLKYTEQEIKQWREARKKHFPTSANVEKRHKNEQILSDVTNQEATLRRQELKEILAKQAELGCEVAEIPSLYLSGGEKYITKPKKHERGQYKRGRFHNKRGMRLQDDQIAKKMKPVDQDSSKTSHRTYEPKPKVREPSLLQKLLTRDIKRDKSHLLQVFRFIAVNSFFMGEPDEALRFPSVIVRETNPDGAMDPSCSINEGSGDKAVDMLDEQLNCEGSVEEEEGEIIYRNASSLCRKEVARGT